MDFYDVVTEENAVAWYEALPTHLKKQLDTLIAEVPAVDVHEEKPLIAADLYAQVTATIGYDLPAHVKVNRGPEGNMPDEIDRFELRHAWCKLYNDLRVPYVVIKHAARVQKERKMLAQALGLKSGGNGLPSQAEGLDDTQAATIRWLQTSGETPLEYLTSVYRNDSDEIKTSDKIAAARALLDYVHRKVPAQVEIKGPSNEEVAETSAIIREVGDSLAKLAAINKKSK